MSLVSFSDPQIARTLLDQIRTNSSKLGSIKIMEVCGTHTMEIGRLGIRQMLPENITLISGPGCPVCVTPGEIIDSAVTLATQQSVTVLTFGDMIRVPGTKSSLEDAQSQGAAVTIVTSPLQAISMAQLEPSKNFVFIAVGFETTIPSVARAVQLASEKKLSNVTFLISHRLVPPALDALIADPEIGISGFLLPGHVSAIIGLTPYRNLITKGIPGVVTGFESLDILNGILTVCTLLQNGDADVKNAYRRVVRQDGNPNAAALINEVFTVVDAPWRGIGVIPQSGLALRDKYAQYDAVNVYHLKPDTDCLLDQTCKCGSVLRGIIRPDQCPMFGSRCTPQTPVGPCMVSTEGSCAAYYRFGG